MFSDSTREEDVRLFKSSSKGLQICAPIISVLAVLFTLFVLFPWYARVFGIWFALPLVTATLTGLQGLASLNPTFRGFLWVWGGAFRSPRDRFVVGAVFTVGLAGLSLFIRMKYS